MRHLPLVALVLLAGCRKPAPSPPTTDDEPAGRVGRLAPPLNAAHWLNGEPVPAFEPGKVYALDFWASWCGPCIQAMPHVQQVAKAYDGRVTVIGVTGLTGRNPLPAVRKVLEMTKAGRSPVRHAVVEGTDTEAAYNVSALPTAVVVGPDGRIAYIGSPLLLEEVLDGVLAGTWKGKASGAAVEGLADELGRIYEVAGRNPTAGLAELAAFERANPATAGRASYRVSKVAVLVSARRFDEAKAITAAVVPVLRDRADVAHLNNLRSIWADPTGNPERTHAALAVAAAEAVVAVEGEADPFAAMGLADALFFAGDKDRARQLADRAVAAAADGTPAKKWLTDQRKRFE